MASSPPRTQAERVRATRSKLIEATIAALDLHGFAATSISVVQQGAAVSRGALTYHFATRNELMVATAKHLLAAALRPTQDGRFADGPLEELVLFYWRRIVNTREGRAFVEILIACRTDPDLQAALGSLFEDWERDIAAAAQARFRTARGAEDAALLWGIARAFLRGLIVHGQFVDDPAHMERMIRRFSDLLANDLEFTPKESPCS